jgi:hypothetical protein
MAVTIADLSCRDISTIIPEGDVRAMLANAKFGTAEGPEPTYT